MADNSYSYSSESDFSSDYASSESGDEDIKTLPYQFEPVMRLDDEISTDHGLQDENDGEEVARSGNTNWCLCQNCSVMDTERESVCCSEIQQVYAKVDEFNEDTASDVKCVTSHPGFQSVCLDRYVLETAYFQYRQQYGEPPNTNHEQQRYVAYRQLARWCWGYLGKEVRVVLPSCAVALIRNTFPSEEYKGFTDV